MKASLTEHVKRIMGFRALSEYLRDNCVWLLKLRLITTGAFTELISAMDVTCLLTVTIAAKCNREYQ